MSRSERRAARIRSDVPIDKVLALYGYDIRTDGSREQQFRCDLHGDGNDGKPSARCYPESASWYCWACNRSRDAIQTVREKEGLGFLQAVERLEQHFHLPSLPWEDSDRAPEKEDVFSGVFDTTANVFEREKSRTERLIHSLVTEKMLALSATLTFMEEFDRLRVVSEANPEGYADDMAALRARIIQRMSGSCTAS